MQLITLDFETAYGKHPRTGENITLSKMTTEEYVRHKHFKIHGVGIKLNDRQPKYFIANEIKKVLMKLPWDNVMLLCQNTLFDGFILSHHFGIVPKFYLDTKSMSRGLYPQDRASLSFMAKRFGVGEKGHELINSKDKWELTDAEQKSMGHYCATAEDSDCNLTYKIFQILKQDFPVEELRNIDLTLRMFCDPILEFDVDVLDDHLYDVQLKKSDLLNKVGANTPEGLKSLRSNQQFADLLRALDVEPPMKLSPAALKKGEKKLTYAFAKSDEGITALLSHPNREVATLVEARLGVKTSIEETRTQRFLGIAERGPLPVALQAYGAGNTLRWAALEKQNLQNLRRGGELRRSIIPPDGYKLVVADLAQIEARMLAWVAGETGLLEAFELKKDPYCEQATTIFQRPIIKGVDTIERNIGKALVLGCGYGMGKVRFGGFLASGPLGMDPILFDLYFSETLGLALYDHMMVDGKMTAVPKIPMEEAAKYTSKLHGDDLLAHAVVCEFLIGAYRGANKQIKKYWRTGEKMLHAMHVGKKMAYGVLSTSQDKLHLPGGLSLHYKNLHVETDEDGEESWAYDGLRGKQYIYGSKLVENIVQALSRIVLTHQMLKISTRYRVVLTVHDEVVCCVREGVADECLDYCMDIMRTPPDWCKGIPLDVDGNIADNYAEAK